MPTDTLPGVDLDALLPCPFCGGPATFCPDNSYGDCYINCTPCDMGPDGAFQKVGDEAKAIAAWNTRATPTHVEALDALALALVDHGHTWTPEQRALYEAATKQRK
jgi:hypothetical protein